MTQSKWRHPGLSSGEEVGRVGPGKTGPSLGASESPVRWSVQAPGPRCSSVHQERTTNDLISKLLVVPAVEVQNK